MKRGFASITAALALGALLALCGCSKDERDMDGGHDEGMEHHGMMEEHDEHGEAMRRQHESMMKLQEEWLKARSAVERGEPSGAAGPAREMEEAAGHQEEFMLHRGADRKDEFLAQTKEFKSLVMRFRAYAEKGDTESLQELAPRIDQACNTCHQSFR